MPLQNATMYQANPEQKGYRDFSYHKDIYFKGHHHYAMYQGDQLLWTCYPDGTMPSAALDGVDDSNIEGKGINRFGYYGLRSYLGHSPSGIPSLIHEAQDYSGPFYYYSLTSLNATFIKPSNTSDEPENFVTGSIPYALVQFYRAVGLLFFVPSTARSWGDNLTLFRLCSGCLTLLRPGGFDRLIFTQDTSGNASTVGQNASISYKTSVINGTIASDGVALNRMAYVSYAYDGGDNRDYNYNRMALNEIRLDGSSSVLANDILRFGYLAISSIHDKHRIGLKATGLESYTDKAFVIGEHIIYLDSFGAHADKEFDRYTGLSVITHASSHQGYDTDRQEDWRSLPHLPIEDTLSLTMPFYDLNGYLLSTDWGNSIYYNRNYTYGFATQYARNETSYDSKFLLYRHQKDSASIDNPIEINFPIATGGSMTLSYSGIQYVEPMVKREGNNEVTRFYLMGQFKVLPEDEDKADIRYYEPADESWHEVHLTQAWYFLETDANFTVLHHEWLGMVPFYSSDPVFSPWTGSFTLIHGADGESVYKVFRWSYLLGNKYYTGGSPSLVRQYISHVDFYHGGVYPSRHKPYVICWGSLSGTGELERGYIYNVTGADPDPILRDVEDLRFVPLTYEKYDMLREGWYEDENGNYHYDPDHEENSGG